MNLKRKSLVIGSFASVCSLPPTSGFQRLNGLAYVNRGCRRSGRFHPISCATVGTEQIFLFFLIGVSLLVWFVLGNYARARTRRSSCIYIFFWGGGSFSKEEEKNIYIVACLICCKTKKSRSKRGLSRCYFTMACWQFLIRSEIEEKKNMCTNTYDT